MHCTVAPIPQHIGCTTGKSLRGDHVEGLRRFFLGKHGYKVCIEKHTIEIRVDDFQIKGSTTWTTTFRFANKVSKGMLQSTIFHSNDLPRTKDQFARRKATEIYSRHRSNTGCTPSICTAGGPFWHPCPHARPRRRGSILRTDLGSKLFKQTHQSPKGKGRRRLTRAALLSTRTRRNWHPSGETRKSLTGSGKLLAAYMRKHL